MLQRKLAPAGNPINFGEVVTSAWGHRLKCSKRGKLFRCSSDSSRELVRAGSEASGQGTKPAIHALSSERITELVC